MSAVSGDSEKESPADRKLKALLESWNLPTFYAILKAKEITLQDLKTLVDPYYMGLVQNGEESMGKMLRFRARHIEWMKSVRSIYSLLRIILMIK